ncbi:MAG: hypothetical protein AAF902_10210 [Chloroflexota bacterium]
MSKSIEILRYLRFSPEGTNKLRIRGELYEAVDDIPDVRVQKVIKQAIVNMIDMAGGIENLIEEGYLSAPVVLVPAAPETDIDKIDVEPPAEIESLIDEPVTEPKNEPAAKIIDPADAVPLPKLDHDFGLSINDQEPSLASQSFLSRLRGIRGRTPNNEVLGPPPDIASQINTVLQGLVEQDPSFVGRRIEMRSAGRGELVFVVDGQYFEGVSDITDPEAAQIIRKAISIWEKR